MSQRTLQPLHSLLPALLAGAATLVAVLAAPGAHAFTAAENTNETYAGAGVGGSARYSQDCGANAVCDRNAKSSGKIYAGHLFSAIPASGAMVSQGAEVMAYKLGSAQASFNSSTGSQVGRGDSKGLGLSYVLQARLDRLAIQARIGFAYASSQVHYAAGGADTDKSFVAPTAGAGLRYALTDSLTLNADWDRLPTRFNGSEKGAVHMFSLGVGYKF